MRILIDGRFLRQKLTGVQRYAIEISQRLVSDPKYYVVVPSAIDKPSEHKDKYITVPDSKYNLPENYFLSLSSTEPRKNIGRLPAAWSRLVAEAPGDVSLVIAGDRAKTFADPGLKDMVGSAKNVVFTGYFPDDDLPALYSGALAFVYPSVFEGFGCASFGGDGLWYARIVLECNLAS
jgi:glycosyltransferase involved in cell wall biosynthesis